MHASASQIWEGVPGGRIDGQIALGTNIFVCQFFPAHMYAKKQRLARQMRETALGMEPAMAQTWTATAADSDGTGAAERTHNHASSLAGATLPKHSMSGLLSAVDQVGRIVGIDRLAEAHFMAAQPTALLSCNVASNGWPEAYTLAPPMMNTLSTAGACPHTIALAAGAVRDMCEPSACNRKDWAPTEDATILNAVDTLGPRWRQIASLLPGRSDDAVRNRWKRLKDAEASGHKLGEHKRASERAGGVQYLCSK
jgi:hypothetical protein